MKFGLELPNHAGFGDVALLSQLAVDAEEAGWDGVFLWDSLYATRWDTQFPDEGRRATVDPWIALAAMAAATQAVQIGPLVAPLARRRPWKVARETATLDQLSGGRLILGVGLGSPDDGAFAAGGEMAGRRERAERLDEALAILDGLWTGERFGFQGRHYQLPPMTFLPRPERRPRVPVWVVGAWPRPRSIARAARWDGIVTARMDGTGLPALEPGQVRALCDRIADLRGGDIQGYAVIAWDARHFASRAAEAERAASYAQAGATWWIDPAWKWITLPDPVGAVRRRIEAGPPTVVGVAAIEEGRAR